MKKMNLLDIKRFKGKPVFLVTENNDKDLKEDNVFGVPGSEVVLVSRVSGENYELYKNINPEDSSRKTYNKIIRDKIRPVIESDCKSATFWIADGKEKELALKNKLMEECFEYFDSEHISELADVLEVIHGLCEAKGISFEEVENLRIKKKNLKGGFSEGCMLGTIEFND